MILYAYFRLSKRLSSQATKLVTDSLKYHGQEQFEPVEMNIFKEEADQAIEELLGPMMALKVTDLTSSLRTIDSCVHLTSKSSR